MYDVKLIVENQLNCQSDTTIFNVFTVEPKPVASFTYQVQPDCDATTDVVFTSTSSLPCTPSPTYNWNFGDGTTAEGSKVNHKYGKNGSYNVTVTVSDDSGTSCGTSKASFVAEVNSKPVPVINIR